MERKEAEEKISQFWDDNKIFEKSVAQRPVDKQYVFYDGPPFATGLPHYGHILSLTCKDLFPRYWTMKGYHVERRWGWDCHGLPIETIAERELGIKEKKEIEKMGIAKFNEFCRSQVLHFAGEWKKTVRRMGKWIEFDNSYKTMDNSYMESVWYILKKLYDNGYVYEGKRVLLFCPRCQTPLATAEIAMDQSYQDVTEETATAKFKLKDEPKETYILAWTTTPWTLIGNVALAINPDLVYSKIKVESKDEFYVLAKLRLSEITEPYEIIEEFQGERLLGKEYEPLYQIKSDQKGYRVVDGGSMVSSEEGTGVVHLALYGEFDYEMIKKYKLPIIQHIGSNGRLLLGPNDWKGEWFKDLDGKVLKDLESRRLLFQKKGYTHPYPFCYRCDTPLIYNAVDSWFINIQSIKQKLIEKNEDITWYPKHIKQGRFRNILDTAPDWNISRNRYWATALPIWKCENKKCRAITVIGSVKELQQNAIELVPDNVDLHKHIVDNIHLKCSKCDGTMNRVPEVFDCWFESGSMPYAAKHYPFENEDWFDKNFPCDFVSEYIGQVRAWFYYMHAISVLLFGKAPFENVVVNGNVLAADGSKMSKSKRNFPDPNLLFDKYGADTLRFYLMTSPLMKAEDLNFNERGVEELYRKVVLLLTNIKTFYELFGTENVVINDNSSDQILDKWIVSRLHSMIRNVTIAFDDYDTVTACNDIIKFIDDLSTWYVRRSRDRFKTENKTVRTEAVQTLAYVLSNLAKITAPVMPFISEEIHQMFRHANPNMTESIHLEMWPSHEDELIDTTLEQNMEQARVIISKALDKRKEAKIPVRQALSKVTISGAKLNPELLDLMKAELNVKSVNLIESDSTSVELDTLITPELLKEGIAREIVRKVNDYRKESNLTVNDSIVLYLECEDKIVTEGIEQFKNEISRSVQARSIEKTSIPNAKIKEAMVHDSVVKIGLKKLDKT